MLDYIGNSGGRDYPFFTDGRALRVATKEDMDRQAEIEQSRHGLKMDARGRCERLGIGGKDRSGKSENGYYGVKIVDAEPLLGGERIVFYYASEDRVDLRDLSKELAEQHDTKIDFKQVGARDEARITADYEKCGQYCCCKNFLKVLKPVSMRSAKTQKATLDPMKISGRCGRLMCCLRYEDETYEALRKKLPNRKKLVGTPDGDGIVIDSQILTQLVLVSLEGTHQRIAVPVEDITEPTGKIASAAPAPVRPTRAPSRERSKREDRPDRESKPDDRGPRDGAGSPETGDKPSKKRRRRGKGKKPAEGQSRGDRQSQKQAPKSESSGEGPTKKKRRRRRRRKPGSGEGGGSGGKSDGGSGGG